MSAPASEILTFLIADVRGYTSFTQTHGDEAFTPDGSSIVTVNDRGRAVLWDVRPTSWARHACEVAGRTLTRAEWKQYLPGRSYHPACK